MLSQRRYDSSLVHGITVPYTSGPCRCARGLARLRSPRRFREERLGGKTTLGRVSRRLVGARAPRPPLVLRSRKETRKAGGTPALPGFVECRRRALEKESSKRSKCATCIPMNANQDECKSRPSVQVLHTFLRRDLRLGKARKRGECHENFKRHHGPEAGPKATGGYLSRLPPPLSCDDQAYYYY